MKMPIGDIIDRYSICKLKSERLELDNSKELSELKYEMEKYEGIEFFADKLYEINGNIWDLESDIRKGNEDILGLEEVGRRAIKIRGFNNIRVNWKNEINSKYGEGYIEVKMNHGSQKNPSVIITLTTVPERLNNDAEDGLRLVLKSLCEQDDDDYEVHFNVPEFYSVNNTPYIIPSWLDDLKLKYKNLKVFRTEDFGPPTKFVPTLKRIKDPNTILIVVDDDLVYHHEMIIEHRKYQNELPNSVICYDGRGSNPLYNDIRDSWVICVTQVTETHGLQHYKSASYKIKLFTSDFYDFYLGKTFSDDVLVSRYFRDNGIPMYSVPYEKDVHLFQTRELWDIHQGVVTFPILRYASSIQDTGCNHPDMLAKQPKFFEAPDLGKRKIQDESSQYTKIYETDKFTHGYIPLYEKTFRNIKNCLNVLEIGIYMGQSLEFLKDFFPNAIIYGIDLYDKKEYDSDRIITLIGNQESRYDLNNIVKQTNCEFDLIIDDGGHTMRQQQITFSVLFKNLKSNGIFIIENLHTSDREPWMNSDDEISTLNMLRYYNENNIIKSNHMTDEEKKYLENNIESIKIWSRTDDFMESVTSIIIKK
jgi:hypothetical protein